MTGPVEKTWLSFAEKVIALEATDAQRKVQRATFFAGAYTMLTLLLSKNAPAMKQAVHDEMTAYFREVTAKRKRN